jgi:hypothetical protein
MRVTSVKRAISLTLFGLGGLAGLAGCAIYPMAVFTVGVNDSWQEVSGISLIFLSLFPLCILALRLPLLAGCLMLLVPCFDIYATFAQRSFMTDVRHFPQPPIDTKQMLGALHLLWPYLTLGLFAIVTSSLGWPRVLHWPRVNSGDIKQV